jgi:uncharacterized protein with HEPN domain
MPKREIAFFVIDMLIALETIQRKTKNLSTPNELLENEDAWFAVTRGLEIVGEAMKYIMASYALGHLRKSSWQDIVSLRNIVAHEYFGIDVDQIFDIAKNDVPELEQELMDLVKQYPDQTSIKLAIEQAIIDMKKAKRHHSVEYLGNLHSLLK